MWLAHNGNESDSGRAEEKLDALNRAGSRIQELVGQIDALPNSPARVLFQECLESVLAFYGYGLERIFELIAKDGLCAARLYAILSCNKVVAGV